MYYGYARVSTQEQNDTSIEVQLEFLKHQSEELGEQFVPKYEKASGKDIEGRSVFKSLLISLKFGDILGVYDNSRLGRNTEENLRIINDLTKRGVKVQISGRFVNPDNPQDELMFTIESSISTYQRKVQLDKSKAGIKQAKENGDWILRGDMYGWDIVRKNGKTIITINEHEANVIRFIFNEYVKGKSCYEVFVELRNQNITLSKSEISACQVRRILLKPIYMGYYFRETGDWKKIHTMTKESAKERLIKSNFYPPIVSEDLWWSVFDSWKSVKRLRSQQFEYRYSNYELSSILKCGYCGAGYVHSYSKAKRTVSEYYVCNVHRKDCTHGPIRPYKLIAFETIMRFTFIATFLAGDEVTSFFTEKQNELLQDTEVIRTEIKEIEKEIKDIDTKQQRLIDAIEGGIIDLSTVKDRLKSLTEENQKLQNRKDALTKSILLQTTEIDDLAEEMSRDVVDEFIHSSLAHRRDLYQRYLSYAKVYDGSLEVEYINGKKFRIFHCDPKQKRIKPQKFLMFYKDTLQGDGEIDIKNGKVEFKPKDIGPETSDEDRVFYEYFNKEILKMEEKIAECLQICSQTTVE